VEEIAKTVPDCWATAVKELHDAITDACKRLPDLVPVDSSAGLMPVPTHGNRANKARQVEQAFCVDLISGAELAPALCKKPIAGTHRETTASTA
jgi:hypothetical protein